VEIPDIIYTLRNLSVRAGYMADAHKKVAGLLLKSGHMVQLNDEIKAKRKALGLAEIPPTALSDPDALKSVQAVMSATGFDKLVGGGK
jgi:heterodisulfide reductase subunit C